MYQLLGIGARMGDFLRKTFENPILEIMFDYIVSVSIPHVKRSKLTVVLSRLFRFLL